MRRTCAAPAGTTPVLLRLVMLTLMADVKLASVNAVNLVRNCVLACASQGSQSISPPQELSGFDIAVDALRAPIHPEFCSRLIQGGPLNMQ